MTQHHGPWQILGTEQKYRNSWIEVCEDRVIQPDGKPGTFTTVNVGGGVSVLPVDEENMVYLVRQFRYAIGTESTEVVSGAVEEGEPALEAAKREAREELGIEAEEWIELGVTHPLTSKVYCPAYLFLARGLRFHETDRESSEKMETVKVSLEEAVRMVMDSEITHGASCVSILKAHLRGGR